MGVAERLRDENSNIFYIYTYDLREFRMKKNTEPPCISCNAHDELEDKFYDMKTLNNIEHTRIITSLKWIIRIGSSLVAGIGIIFFMVWGLHTKENGTEAKISEIDTKMEYVRMDLKETKADVHKHIDKCKDKMSGCSIKGKI